MHRNTQPIEKPDLREDGTLDLHSVFFTIQGEGPYAGHRAVFVRLAGCNLQCPGCDTEYTKGRRRVTPSELLDEVFSASPLSPKKPLVVITGGEPFRQNLADFCRLLALSRFPIQIESNGVLAPTPAMEDLIRAGFVEVVISPKTSRISPVWGQLAKAFKYVLQDGAVSSDLLPITALEHRATPRVARPPEDFNGPIYVNPMDEKDVVRNHLNLLAVVQATMERGYIAGVQMHKIMDMK